MIPTAKLLRFRVQIDISMHSQRAQAKQSMIYAAKPKIAMLFRIIKVEK